jgi:hypothetical protein
LISCVLPHGSCTGFGIVSINFISVIY